jgi:hypothetical protein
VQYAMVAPEWPAVRERLAARLATGWAAGRFVARPAVGAEEEPA